MKQYYDQLQNIEEPQPSHPKIPHLFHPLTIVVNQITLIYFKLYTYEA